MFYSEIKVSPFPVLLWFTFSARRTARHAGSCSSPTAFHAQFCSFERYGGRESPILLVLDHYDFPLPLLQAPPRAKRRANLRAFGERDRNEVCVITDDIVFTSPGRLVKLKKSNLGFKRRRNQQRRGGVP